MNWIQRYIGYFLLSPSYFILISDHLPTVPDKGGVEVEDDVDEEDNVDNRVEHDHPDRTDVD